MKVVRQAKQEDNCLAAIQNVINCLHINVSNEAIHEVRQQRSYPSVQCILDAFKQWNVNALAVNLDHTHLDKIPCPAIAHTKTDNGHFVVVTNISRESVTCIDPARGKTTVGIGAFLETWTGVTILFSKTKTSGEKDYAIRRQQKADATIRGIGAAAVFIVLTGIALVCAPVVTASTVGLMVAKSAGLWLGLSLLSREFGISSKVLDLFCGAGNSTCDTVLSSPRSKLFHVLGLAELATLYFGGSWLALLLAVPAETDILTPLFVVGISGIPIVMYTLYEQAIRLKKWCALCLLVTAVYVSDITLISLEIATPVAFRIQALIPVVFGFLIPVMLWILLRPRIAGAARLRQNEKILSDFKENPAVFYALLHEKQRRPIPQSLEPVIIGSDHARVVITLITNPLCASCAIVHAQLQRVVELIGDGLSINLVFSGSGKEDAIDRQVAERIIAWSLSHSAETLVHEWLTKEDKTEAATWLERYPVSAEDRMRAREVYSRHVSWCKQQAITFTPAILLDGRDVPAHYSVKELIHLIPAYCERVMTAKKAVTEIDT